MTPNVARTLWHHLETINAVAYFTAVVLGTRIKLDILATHLATAAKRLFGIPNFRLYALADGIREVCARSPRRPPPATNALPQLTLGLPLRFLGKVLANPLTSTGRSL